MIGIGNGLRRFVSVIFDHPHKWVRWNAITGLSHIARIHGRLDTATVMPRLNALKDDPEIGSNVQDSLADIPFFLRKRVQ
jgi:hypothetical protein